MARLVFRLAIGILLFPVFPIGFFALGIYVWEYLKPELTVGWIMGISGYIFVWIVWAWIVSDIGARAMTDVILALGGMDNIKK